MIYQLLDVIVIVLFLLLVIVGVIVGMKLFPVGGTLISFFIAFSFMVYIVNAAMRT